MFVFSLVEERLKDDTTVKFLVANLSNTFVVGHDDDEAEREKGLRNWLQQVCDNQHEGKSEKEPNHVISKIFLNRSSQDHAVISKMRLLKLLNKHYRVNSSSFMHPRVDILGSNLD